jgi:hypothetical protein
MGEVLVFSMFPVHASLDNRSKQIRLSSDSRYQPAGLPTDERWIGANPIGHGEAESAAKSVETVLQRPNHAAGSESPVAW